MVNGLRPLLALLTILVLAGIATYVLVRRPGQRSAWALALMLAGFIVFYLGDFFLFQPNVSLAANYSWQRLQSYGGNLGLVAALTFAVTLRHQPLAAWEKALASLLVVRAIVDDMVVAAIVPRGQPGCVLASGLPKLHCGQLNDVFAILALVAFTATLIFFYRAVRLAPDREQRIIAQHMMPIWICAIAAGAITVFSGVGRSIALPSALATMIGAALFSRTLFRLETEERGLKLGWLQAGLATLALLTIVVDLLVIRNDVPLLSLLVMFGGFAGMLGWALGTQRTRPDRDGDLAADTPVPAPAERAAVPRLEIRLFGPLRVSRGHLVLPAPPATWRSAKERSLLAFLALRGAEGATQAEIVDALWPLPSELDAEAERRSRNTFRSYLSTLRRILEPDGPRGSERYIEHDGERYRLCDSPEVWVDVWSFDRLSNEADRLAALGEAAAAAGACMKALEICGSAGLLLDELELPGDCLEPERERLRRRRLKALHRLAQYRSSEGATEAAAAYWEQIIAVEPLDADAYAWLASYYRTTGQISRLAALGSVRKRKELEMDLP